MMTLQRETAAQIQPVFLVGDVVDVLNALHLPMFEKVTRTGTVERITYQSTDGEPLYWISGVPCARTARVLRLVKRGRA